MITLHIVVILQYSIWVADRITR